MILNSNTAGPDGLTIHHLKNMGPLGLQYLTHLYSLANTPQQLTLVWLANTPQQLTLIG